MKYCWRFRNAYNHFRFLAYSFHHLRRVNYTFWLIAEFLKRLNWRTNHLSHEQKLVHLHTIRGYSTLSSGMKSNIQLREWRIYTASMFGGCLKGIDTYLHDIMTYILNVQSLKYSHTHTHLNLYRYIHMYVQYFNRKKVCACWRVESWLGICAGSIFHVHFAWQVWDGQIITPFLIY